RNQERAAHRRRMRSPAEPAEPCERRGTVTMRSLPAIFNQAISEPIVPKTAWWKAAALATGLGVGMLSYPVHAAPASGGDTVQGLYDVLLSTMKNGRTLG